MRFLFIKFKNIGDTLLLTPTLDAIKTRYPESEIHVLVRRGTESILAGCRSVDRVWLSVRPEKRARSLQERWEGFTLLRELRKVPFDFVIVASPEDRAVIHAAALKGRRKVINIVRMSFLGRLVSGLFSDRQEFEFNCVHAVERDYELVKDLLKLPETPPPMRFDTTDIDELAFARPGEDFVVVHGATRWPVKEWPEDRWQRLVKFLAGKFTKVIVSVGPVEAERAFGRRVCEGAPPNVVSTDGKVSWLELGAHLKRAKLFVGVDTAAMHLAAACSCPSIVIWGPSMIELWRPWRNPHRLVYDETVEFDPTEGFVAYNRALPRRRVDAVTYEQVEKAVVDFTRNNIL